MISKKRKKELRKIYEEKKAKEFFEKLDQQEYSPFEWVTYMTMGSDENDD
ncbi:nucleoside-diphosphate kinase [[Muricauda] lutisoli]|uniref:Uncharacterized protein n=1 Tax=[Muricauda] lutisoli TaxID=2816035 RepID=A0ABS3EU27_9FLAO|nr:hypothetical protein [[Muricauda] lutisoli]MBO0329752.1 hypothetical protein [[Muricauda] lutisoli]